MTVEQIKKLLKRDEVLLYYFVSPLRTFIWALRNKGPISFAVIPIEQISLEQEIKKIRTYLSPDLISQTHKFRDFNVELSHDLYKKLLEPVRDVWNSSKEILVVPDGPIGQLPFATLVTTPDPLPQNSGLLFSNHTQIDWLIKTHAITMLPTASTLSILRSLPSVKGYRNSFVGFGDPFFNQSQAIHSSDYENNVTLTSRGIKFKYRGVRRIKKGGNDAENIYSSHLGMLNRLPDTRQEILAIAKTLGANNETDVFLGLEASEDRVKQMDLSNRKIIVFATHALIPGDLDGLEQPAIALSTPEITGGKEDGLLTMGEVMGLKLNADWVVLSACNTAASEEYSFEMVSGLGQAFFYAGARTLLVTSWPVETISARKITTGLFEYQKKDQSLSKAQSLRKSILKLMNEPGFLDKDSGQSLYSHAHPLFWAPFFVVGESSTDQIPIK